MVGVSMQRRWAKPALFIFLILFMLTTVLQSPVEASELVQLPTGSIPTVTSTSSGPMVRMLPGPENQANLRSGPGALFDRVGVLLLHQLLPAKGRSPGGEWIMVEYPGVSSGTAWVYAPLVEIVPMTQLPIVEPPPTPTPIVTATIDPTLAARFIVTLEPTRLPTFTPPPPLAIPTFIPEAGPALGGMPMGMIILGLAALGIFLGLVAFSQGR
jgi:hypothetical protein